MLKLCSSLHYCLHRKTLLVITGVTIGAIAISLLINTIALSQTSALKIGDKLPDITLVTIDDPLFGGWAKAQPTHFGDGGVFDQIYKPGN